MPSPLEMNYTSNPEALGRYTTPLLLFTNERCWEGPGHLSVRSVTSSGLREDWRPQVKGMKMPHRNGAADLGGCASSTLPRAALTVLFRRLMVSSDLKNTDTGLNLKARSHVTIWQAVLGEFGNKVETRITTTQVAEKPHNAKVQVQPT